MTLFEALKTYELRHLLEARGIAVNPQGFAQAPWRAERTASVKIYDDHFYDFGDNEKRGDFINWLVWEGLSPEQAREEAAQVIGFNDAKPSNVLTPSKPKPTIKPTLAQKNPGWIHDLVTQAKDALATRTSLESEQAWRYLEQRGLTGVAESYQLGVVDEQVRVPQAGSMLARLRGRLIVPTVIDGKAVWFKARECSGQSSEELKARNIPRYDGPSGTVPAPFNADILGDAGLLGFVVLCEGELDALSLLSVYGSGYPVLGLSGGLLPAGWDDKLRRAAISELIIVMDADAAGKKHATKLQQTLTPLGLKTLLIDLPEGEDLNSLLLHWGGEKLRAFFDDACERARLESIADYGYLSGGWLRELDERATRPYQVYTTGVTPLDTLLEDGYSEGLHLLGGITGGGKTSLALAIATGNAEAGRSVIYASYEQPRRELWARIASGLTGIPYKAVKRGYLVAPDGERTLTSQLLKANPLWPKLETIAKGLKIVEGGDALSRQEGSYTVETLAQLAQSVTEQRGSPPLIVLDYVQRMPVPSEVRVKDNRERVDYIAGQLQTHLARDLGCTILALSSINRASYNLALSTLDEQLSAFKESGMLEYTAYTALLVYKLSDDLEYQLNLKPGGLNKFVPMTLSLCKHREGERGRVAVKWEPKRGTWREGQLLKRDDG